MALRVLVEGNDVLVVLPTGYIALMTRAPSIQSSFAPGDYQPRRVALVNCRGADHKLSLAFLCYLHNKYIKYDIFEQQLKHVKESKDYHIYVRKLKCYTESINLQLSVSSDKVLVDRRGRERVLTPRVCVVLQNKPINFQLSVSPSKVKYRWFATSTWRLKRQWCGSYVG